MANLLFSCLTFSCPLDWMAETTIKAPYPVALAFQFAPNPIYTVMPYYKKSFSPTPSLKRVLGRRGPQIPGQTTERSSPISLWLTSARRLLPLVVVTALPIIFDWEVWSKLWVGVRPRAWDGSGHYVLAQIYDQSIFPDTFGWTHAYSGGMPFPNFYPPLFYWSIALLHHTHLVSFNGAFKLILAVSTLLLPVAVWMIACAVSQKNRLVAICAACAVLPLLVDKRFFYPLGLGHASTFLVGLYSAPLGFVLLVAWYVVYLGAHRGRWHLILASLLLALASLANFFSTVIATLFVAATVVTDLVKHCRAIDQEARNEARKALIAHSVSPLIAVGLASFWIIPMIGASEFFVTRPHTGPLNELLPPMMYGWYALSLIGAVYWLRRPTERMWPFLATLIALAISITFSSLLAPSWFPLQAPRFLSPLNFLLAVPVGIAIAAGLNKLKAVTGGSALGQRPLSDWFKQPWNRGSITRLLIVAGVPIALFGGLLIWLTPPSYGLAFFPTTENERIDSVLRFAKEHRDGRYLIEVPPFSRPGPALDSRALNAYLGEQGNEALTVFHREVSPNAIFFNPLLNVFSPVADNYGISSLLVNDLDFAQQPLAQHLERARLVGVKYLVIFSPRMKDRLAKESGIGVRYDFGAWTVFELQGEPAPRIRALHFRPALVVSRFSLKHRRNNERDFIRWAEEQFADSWFDVLLARSAETKIDRLQGLNQFGALILDNYDCDDENLAFERLRSFAQQRALILLSSDSALFHRLQAAIADFPKAEIIERVPDTDGEWLGEGKPRHYQSSNIRKEWQAIRRVLEQQKMATNVTTAISGEISQKVIQLAPGDQSSTDSLPVLINTTYHPNWRREDGGAIYAATPFFMLTFIHQPARLVYVRNWLDRTAMWVSVTTLIICCFGVRFRKKAG